MLLHGLPTIRQFIWIWKRSSASLFGSATSSFTFRCIQWISSPLPLSLLLPAVLFNPLFLSPFFPAYRSGSAPPSYSHHADRSAGHQRGFISHSETASSLMDGSAILFNSPPLRPPPLSLSLPPYTYPLARLLSLLSLSLSLRRRRRRRLFSRSFFFLRVYPTTRCEIIYCGWILAKNSRVSMPRNTRIPNIPNFFPLPPRFVFLLVRYDARGYGR